MTVLVIRLNVLDCTEKRNEALRMETFGFGRFLRKTNALKKSLVFREHLPKLSVTM